MTDFRHQLAAAIRDDDADALSVLIDQAAADRTTDGLLLLTARCWLVLLLGRSLSENGLPQDVDLERVDTVGDLIQRRVRALGYDPRV